MKNYTVYKNVTNPKGIIQIIHGMSEHSKRYLKLVNFFNKNSYIVVLSDHPNHGLQALKNKNLGIVDYKFQIFVSNQLDITKAINKEYPNLPIFILGHSMGSFIAQSHLKFNEIPSSYILSGSCKNKKILYLSGASLFKVISIFSKKPKSIYNKVLFFSCNSKEKPNSSPFSWLSLNSNNVLSYEKDPLCGFSYNSNFYYEFLSFLGNLFIKKDFKSIDKNIPILILSGDGDPIGLYGKGTNELYSFYKELNFKKVTYKLFTNLKHELFQEDDLYKVKEYTLNWINFNNKKTEDL